MDLFLQVMITFYLLVRYHGKYVLVISLNKPELTVYTASRGRDTISPARLTLLLCVRKVLSNNTKFFVANQFSYGQDFISCSIPSVQEVGTHFIVT